MKKKIFGIAASAVFFLTIFVPACSADIEYPDDPIAGCVGFDGWWETPEKTIAAKEMIYWVITQLVLLGYSDEEILDISAGMSDEGII